MTRPVTKHPWLSASLCAVLLSVACRPWGLGALAWVAFVPLFAVLPTSRSWWKAGALAGVTALGITVLAYEPVAVLGLGWLGFAILVGAAPFALAGAAAWLTLRRLPPSFAYVATALFWAVAELVPAQPWLLGQYALPMSTVGYSQAGLPAMHLARFSSVTLTSTTLLLTNALFAHLIVVAAAARLGGVRAVAGPLAAVCAGLGGMALLVLGAYLTAPSGAEPTIDVALAQPNRPTAILAAATRVPAVQSAVLHELGALAADLAEHAPNTPAPHLLVLPEGAWPQPLSTHDPSASLTPAGAAALARFPTTVMGAAGRTEDGLSTNSAFVWNGTELTHAYAKVHLVPIGEAGLVAGATHATVAVAVPHEPDLLVAPFICYDIVFAATVRAAVRGGAELVAVLTDDAFAARGAVPHQHLRLARFRAVENGVPLAFVSNTGPSALMSPGGATIAAAGSGETTVVRARLGAGTGSTPYVRYGNWVGALVCLAAASLAVIAAARAAGKKGGVPSDGRHKN